MEPPSCVHPFPLARRCRTSRKVFEKMVEEVNVIKGVPFIDWFRNFFVLVGNVFGIVSLCFHHYSTTYCEYNTVVNYDPYIDKGIKYIRIIFARDVPWIISPVWCLLRLSLIYHCGFIDTVIFKYVGRTQYDENNRFLCGYDGTYWGLITMVLNRIFTGFESSLFYGRRFMPF